MKPLTLLWSDPVASGESRGHSSYASQSLESCILAQPLSSTPASSIFSSSLALQPSRLSSTQLNQDLFPSISSSLYSPQHLSSTLQNTVLPAKRPSSGGHSAEGFAPAGLHTEECSTGGLSAGGVSTNGPGPERLSVGGLSAGPTEEQPSAAQTTKNTLQVIKDHQFCGEEPTKVC